MASRSSDIASAHEDEPGLGFSLHTDEGSARLALADRTYFGWLKIDRLELALPRMTAAEVTSARPESFQRKRTRATELDVRVGQSDLDRLVAGTGSELASLGADELGLRLYEGFVSLVARLREGRHTAEITAALHICARGDSARVLVGDARGFGFLPTPAPVLAHRLVLCLLGGAAGDPGPARARELGLCDIEIGPLTGLFWRLFPPAGWRLPATRSLAAEHVECRRGELALRYRETGDPAPTPATSEQADRLAQTLETFRDADERLLAGDLDGALRAYRGELAARGPEELFVVERILAIAAAQPDYFSDAAELARQALGRWPELPAAHAALATIAAAQGDSASAASRYRRLADALADAGDDEGESRACLAAARLLRGPSPEASTPLYERVIERRPDHPEAAEALAERYSDEARHADLARLIRARIAATTDPQLKARDHLRLAQLLAERLGDPAAARAELDRACELDRSQPGTRETLAEIELSLGFPNAALEALEEAGSLYESRGDDRARARVLWRAAGILEDQGEAERAGGMYERAAELTPDDEAARDGAARAAGAAGRHADAAALWEELAAREGQPPMSQARYLALAGREARRAGDTERGKQLLWRAAAGGFPDAAADARSELAAIAQSEDRLHEAAELLERAVADYLAAADRDDESADKSSARRPGARDARAPEALRELSARSALALGAVAAELGDDDAAKQHYLHAHRFAGSQHTSASAAAALREVARAAGDADEERAWLGALIDAASSETKRAPLLLERATLDLARGDHDRAEADAARAEQAGDDGPRNRALSLRAEISRARGDLAAFAELLERREGTARSPAEYADAAADSAEALLEAGHDERALAAARRAREAASELDPEEVRERAARRAASALGEAAWRCRAWDDTCRAYAELVYDAAGPAGSLRALAAYRLGIACEARGELDRAAAALETASAEDAAPADVRGAARRALASVYEKRGEPLSAATALEAFGRSEGPGDDARADALYRAGELRLEHDGAAAAEACFEEALAQVPDHLRALDALERRHREAGDTERLAVVLGRKIAATASHPLRQRTLLCRLAAVQEELGRPDVALESYERALEADADYRPALRAVAEASRARGSLDRSMRAYDRLARVLRGDSELPGPDDELAEERLCAALALVEIAYEAPGVSGIHERAMARVSENLRACPGDERLLSALTALRARGTGGETPPLAGAQTSGAGQWGSEADALEAPAEALWAHPPPVATPVATIDDDLPDGEHEASADAGADMPAEDPAGSEPAAAHTAGARAEIDDRGPDAVDEPARETHPVGEDDPADSAEALRERAQAARGRGEVAESARLLRRAAQLAPGDPELLREGADAASALGDPEEHVRWLEALAAATDEPASARGELYLEIADLCYDRLGDGAEARRAMWRAADAFGSGSRRDATLRLLATEAASQDLTHETIDALEALGPRGQKPSERINLARCYRRVGREQRAIEVLEEERRGGDLSEEGATLLFSLYRERKHKQALAASLERGAEGAPDTIASTRLREALQIYEESAGDDAAAERVKARLEAIEAPGPGAQAPRTTSPDQLEAAADAAALTGETDVAADLWCRAIFGRARGPDGQRQVAALLERLRGTWFGSQYPGTLAGALERAATEDTDRAVAADLYEEAAALRRGSGDVRGSADALGKALARRPEDARLCRELAFQLAALGEYSQIAAACELHLTMAEGERRGFPLAVLAVLSRDVFGDPEYAHAYEREARQVAADFDELSKSAEALLGRAAAPEPEPEAEAEPEPEPEPHTQPASGSPAELDIEPFGPGPDSADPASAEHTGADAARAEALEAEGHFDAAIAAWESVARERPEDSRPLRALEWLYAEVGDPQGLAEILARLAARENDAEERADLWYRRGKLCRDVLGEEAEAYRSLMEAHRAHPGDARVAYALRSLAMVRGDWQLASDLIGREIAGTTSPHEAGALHFERGLIREEKLRDPDGAIDSYEQAVALDPDIPAVRKPLARLYELAGRREEAAGAFEAAADVAKTPDEQSDLLRRAQGIYSALAAGADTDTDRRVALEGLARSATLAGELGTALGAAEELLELLPGVDVSAVPAVRLQIAELYHRVGDTRRALDELEIVRAEEPKSTAALSRLVQLYTEVDDAAGAARSLHALINITHSPGQRAELLFELGELYLTRLGDDERAFDAHLKSADLDPQNPLTLRRLIEHYSWEGAFENVVDAADELATQRALTAADTPREVLARVALAACVCGRDGQAAALARELGEGAGALIAAALADVARAGSLTQDAIDDVARALEASDLASRDELAETLPATPVTAGG